VGICKVGFRESLLRPGNHVFDGTVSMFNDVFTNWDLSKSKIHLYKSEKKKKFETFISLDCQTH